MIPPFSEIKLQAALDQTTWDLHPALNISTSWSNLQNNISSTNNTIIYTDGSKGEAGAPNVGAAFVAYRQHLEYYSESFSLPNYRTNYQAEAIAILKALKWASEEKLSTINIATDSQAVLKALGSPVVKNEIIRDIKMQFLQLQGKSKINLYYVTAHKGIQGNERADQLAKAASLYQPINYSNTKITIQALKTKLKQTAKNIWQKNWNNIDKGRWTHQLIPQVSYELTSDNYYMTQLLTAHGRFGSHLYKIKIRTSPGCICGAIEASLPHYLMDCPRTLQKRRALNIPNIQNNLQSWYNKVKENEQLTKLTQELLREINQLDQPQQDN